MGAVAGSIGLKDKSVVKRIISSQKHRALDGFNSYYDGFGSLTQGITKIGKDYCPKPIVNEEGTVVLLMDGRLFNSKELKDTLKQRHEFSTTFSGEVILHLYEEQGMKFVSALEGDFGFCLYDATKKKVFLCSDCAGSKPLYYALIDEGFLFSSDIKTLVDSCLLEKRLNEEAVRLFMIYVLLPTEDMLIKNVKKVMPSHYVEFDNGTVISHRYFEVSEHFKNKNEDYFVKKTRSLLERAIFDRIMDRVPVFVALGGLDSGAVAALLAQKVDKVHTFTTIAKGDYDETALARQVAEIHGFDHQEIVFDEDSIEYYYRNILPHYSWPSVIDFGSVHGSNITKRIGKRSLYFTGEGADPIFGGLRNGLMMVTNRFLHYPTRIRHYISWMINFYNKIDQWYVTRSYSLLGRKQAYRKPYPNMVFNERTLFNTLEESYVFLVDSFYFLPFLKDKPVNKIDLLRFYRDYFTDERFCFLNRNMKLYTELKGFKEHLARNETLATLSGSINNVPFLDKRILEFSYSIPPRLKYNSRYYNKIMVAKATKDLFSGIVVPKKGFTKGLKMVFMEYANNNRSVLHTLLKTSDVYNQFNKKFLLKSAQDPSLIGPARFHTLLSLGLWYEYCFNDVNPRKFV